MKFSKMVLIAVFIYMIYFVERVFSIVENGIAEPYVLIGAVFGAIIGEVSILGMIKKKKLHKEILIESERGDIQ